FRYNAASTLYCHTLSLHDALPIYWVIFGPPQHICFAIFPHHITVFTGTICLFHISQRLFVYGEVSNRTSKLWGHIGDWMYGYLLDRKSTRLNSSHVSISYAVFCLK